MIKLSAILIVLIVLGCTSCNQRTGGNYISPEKGIITPIKYARGFKIESFPDYRKITVLSPWQKSSGISIDYYLVPENKKIPVQLSGKQIIRIPVKSIVCLSTSHIGFLKAIQEISSLVGISGSDFVSDSTVLEHIKCKKIIDVGYDQGLNYERILALKPDLIMAYGVGSEVTSVINKLKDLRLNVILNAEYLEESPLAKTEWIKLIGILYNREKEANDYFTFIEKNYKAVKDKVSHVKRRPFVLTGLPFKDSWWMAGGKSNLAQLISDAGGAFLWDDNQSREAFVVSLEEVIVRSAKADYWINCGTVSSINELISLDSRFSSFPQVKHRAIYNNNLVTSGNGGNDYWERGVVRPDLILSDLVKIFHPECDSGRVFNFYKKIE